MKKIAILMAVVLISAFASAVPAEVQTAPCCSIGIGNPHPGGSPTVVATCGQGFLEDRGEMRVLYLEGMPYEMGYQHGFLLADDIMERFSTTMVLIALMRWGTLDVSEGWDSLVLAAESVAQYIPPEYREELRGIADGLTAAGSPLTYEDILVWNTFGDSTFAAIRMGQEVPEQPSIKQPFPGCSSFSAWNEATTDGKLVYGGNTDLYFLKETEQKPTVLVAQPDSGYGFICPFGRSGALPGTIGSLVGMNQAGLIVSIHNSPSQDISLLGTPLTMIQRYILQHAGSIDEAVTILSLFPRTVGAIYHVADGKAREAAAIEVSASEIAVRYSEPGSDVLWTTNHYNCYPGWQGYDGNNMVVEQGYYELADISTVEKWQDGLSTGSNTQSTFQRYERLRQLLSENYGEITIDTAIDIVSDRYDIVEGRELGWTEYGDGYPVCQSGDVLIALEDVPHYKRDETGPLTLYQMSTVASVVAVPADGVILIAMGECPAPRGSYVYFNLSEEISDTKPAGGMAMPIAAMVVAAIALILSAITFIVVFIRKRA